MGLHCQQLLGGREGDCPPVGPYPPWMELIRQKEKAEVGGELGSLPPGRQSPPWGRTPARLALWGKSGPSLPPVPPYRGPPPTPARDTHPPPPQGPSRVPPSSHPPTGDTPPPCPFTPRGLPSHGHPRPHACPRTFRRPPSPRAPPSPRQPVPVLPRGSREIPGRPAPPREGAAGIRSPPSPGTAHPSHVTRPAPPAANRKAGGAGATV